MAENIDNQYEPLAVAGYQSSGGNVDDDYLPELRGEKGRRILRQMTNDETIGAFLLGLNSIYGTLSWYVDPSDKDDKQAVEYAGWLENALFKEIGDPRGAQPDDTWGAFVQTFAEIDAFGWGYYDVWIKDLPDGSVGVARLMGVAPETLWEWKIEDDGDVTALVQQSPRTYKYRTISTDRALHIVSQPYKGSPEGRSIFRTAYRMWYYKKLNLELESILHERGAGFPVMYVHADVVKQSKQLGADGKPTPLALLAKQAMQTYEVMVKNIKRNQQSGAVVYYDTVKNINADGSITNTNIKTVELKLESPGASNTQDMGATIKRLDASLARALLFDFMMFNTDGGSGQSGGLNGRVDMFVKVITGLLENKVETINRQLVTQLWKLNGFKADKMPKIRAGAIQREDVHKVVSTLEGLARAGMMVGADEDLQRYVYEELGLPTDNIGKSPGLPSLEDDAVDG